MTTHWKDQKERAGFVWIAIVAWVALNLGRIPVRLLLLPITGFYLVFAGDAVAASRDYLSRVLKRKPSILEVWKHFFYFATVSVDRLFFLAGKTDRFSMTFSGRELLQNYIDKKQGCLILVSHLGSFDALRVSALKMQSLPLKIVMDHQHNPAMMQLIDSLNPEMAGKIIDSNQSGPALALKLSEDLNAGHMIGIMADRTFGSEQTVTCQLVDGDVELPIGVWQLASTLGVPVLSCFGIYQGGNHYSVHVEKVASDFTFRRKERLAKIAEYAQVYASQMNRFILLNPFNWFNFYSYWKKGPSGENSNASTTR